jgi:hypothetical protein
LVLYRGRAGVFGFGYCEGKKKNKKTEAEAAGFFGVPEIEFLFANC